MKDGRSVTLTAEQRNQAADCGQSKKQPGDKQAESEGEGAHREGSCWRGPASEMGVSRRRTRARRKVATRVRRGAAMVVARARGQGRWGLAGARKVVWARGRWGAQGR